MNKKDICEKEKRKTETIKNITFKTGYIR